MNNLLQSKYFDSLLKYAIILKPLKLEIGKNFYINGLESFLIAFDKTSTILQMTQLKTIILKGIPHLILTNNENKFGQIFTSSKKIYITKDQAFDSYELCKDKQYIFFSLVNPDEILNEPYLNTIKHFNEIGINPPQEYVGFIYKLNLIYWTELSEKIIWQSKDPSLNMILNKDQLPLINNDMDSFKDNPMLYLRYKYTPNSIYTKEYFTNLEICNDIRKELLLLNNEEVYINMLKSNIIDFSITEAELKEGYKGFNIDLNKF